MTRKFGVAAPGKNRHQLFRWIETKRWEKCFASLRWRHIADQWVADEFHGHACIAEEFFFEWENAERQRKSPFHDAHSPRPPRPELRTDVINVANTERFQFAGQAQVEAGKVSQDCKRGPAFL